MRVSLVTLGGCGKVQLPMNAGERCSDAQDLRQLMTLRCDPFTTRNDLAHDPMMSTPTSRVRPVDPGECLAAVVAGLGDRRVDRLVAAVSRAVFADVPEVAADDRMREQSAEAIWQNMRTLVFVGLADTDSANRVRTPGQAVAARMLMEHSVPLERLIKSYRVAQSAFWAAWMSEVGETVADPGDRMAVLQLSWSRVSTWFETQTEMMVETYIQERQQWVQGTAARRTELIHRLLAGDPVERDTAEAVLGIGLSATVTATEIWTDGPDGSSHAIADAVRALPGVADGARVVSIPSGANTAWCWISSAAPPRSERVRACHAELPPGLHIAWGRSAHGLEGFRASHEDATLTRRVISRFADPPAAVLFDDVEVLCLISGEAAAVRRFVAHELGPLVARTEHAARLREAVRVFLEEGASARAAAERLHTHRNTVYHQLERAAEALGRPITERRLELELALRIVDRHGPEILPD